jgi:hypothetical protein
MRGSALRAVERRRSDIDREQAVASIGQHPRQDANRTADLESAFRVF